MKTPPSEVNLKNEDILKKEEFLQKEDTLKNEEHIDSGRPKIQNGYLGIFTSKMGILSDLFFFFGWGLRVIIIQTLFKKRDPPRFKNSQIDFFLQPPSLKEFFPNFSFINYDTSLNIST